MSLLWLNLSESGGLLATNRASSKHEHYQFKTRYLQNNSDLTKFFIIKPKNPDNLVKTQIWVEKPSTGSPADESRAFPLEVAKRPLFMATLQAVRRQNLY